MKIEYVVEILELIIPAFLLWRLTPKEKIRDAHVIFLFNQIITWPAGHLVVNLHLIEYPVRLFSYAAIELIAKMQNGISYHNGWTLGWSILFNFAIFSFLRVHYLKPILAGALSAIIIIFIFVVFNIPVKVIN